MRSVFAGKRRTPSHKLFEKLVGRILKDSYRFQGVYIHSGTNLHFQTHHDRCVFIEDRFKLKPVHF